MPSFPPRFLIAGRTIGLGTQAGIGIVGDPASAIRASLSLSWSWPWPWLVWLACVMQPIMMSSQPPPAVRDSLATASTSVSVPAVASASASASASSASPQLSSSPQSSSTASTSDTVTCAAFVASSAAAPLATYSNDPSSAVHQQPNLNALVTSPLQLISILIYTASASTLALPLGLDKYH
ncbi:hypothetical protein CI102_808 [Trichoderma harzianum]|nr:hypothetical protein CI102_808 [Trichoderma harzianum]